MIHGCLLTVSHKFSMYSIQKLGNTLLFLEKNIVGVENVEDNDEDINQFEEMSLVTNPMNIMHLEKDLRRIFCPICEKVAKKNLHDLFV
jgi:hypothetical protein